MAAAVRDARTIQQERYGPRSATTNGTLSGSALRRHCTLDAPGEDVLRGATEELHLSARAHTRVLRVARTIADLEASDRVKAHHVAEAVQYRLLDRDGPG